MIGPGSSVDYVWDDLTLPHKLVVKIDGNYLFCFVYSWQIYTFSTINHNFIRVFFCRYSCIT